jgi:glycine/sarcosine N-methyltransferase
MYDVLSADYDRFVDWQARLSIELPFIIEQLHLAKARKVLDAACGTGMHAIALVQCGFSALGADISQGMVERARQNAASARVKVPFKQAGFGSLAGALGEGSFDAVLCLGNSLPHLLSPAELEAALADFAACLRPGGLLLVQERNFDRVMARHERWMDPQWHSEGDSQWLFLRLYDFDPDGLLTFNMITLRREGAGKWSQAASSSRLRPVLKTELFASLEGAGFSHLAAYGDMVEAPFDPATSPNLVITGRALA